MVKLTLEMMVKKPSGISKKKKDESINSFLRKLTHLNLENRNLDETVVRHISHLCYISDKNLMPNVACAAY